MEYSAKALGLLRNSPKEFQKRFLRGIVAPFFGQERPQCDPQSDGDAAHFSPSLQHQPLVFRGLPYVYLC
jgi:hypothetical protein